MVEPTVGPERVGEGREGGGVVVQGGKVVRDVSSFGDEAGIYMKVREGR